MSSDQDQENMNGSSHENQENSSVLDKSQDMEDSVLEYNEEENENFEIPDSDFFGNEESEAQRKEDERKKQEDIDSQLAAQYLYDSFDGENPPSSSLTSSGPENQPPPYRVVPPRRAARDFIQSDELAAAFDSLAVKDDFLARFEEEMSITHPAFRPEPFSEAMARAKSEFKILVVYLHHHTLPESLPFCVGTLCVPSNAEFIDTHFLFWVGEIDLSMEERITEFLGTKINFPLLIFMADLGGGTAVIDTSQGLKTHEELFIQMLQLQENQAPVLQNLKEQHFFREEKAREARDIKQEQEEAFLASLQQDMEKEKQKQEEEELRQIEEQFLQQEEELRRAEEEARRQEKLQKKNILPPEPEKGPNVAHIVFRFPTDKKLERRFRAEEKVQVLFDFVDSSIDQSEFNAEHYVLCTSFPRRVLLDPNVTLKEAGLVPQVLLHVQEK